MSPSTLRRIPALRPRGFTLLELLVVISIISILVAMLLPALSKTRTVAQQIACASKLRQVAVGTTAYRLDHKDWLPQMRMSGSVYTWGLGNATYSRTLEDYWPITMRYCPTVGTPNPNATFEWTYSAPMLGNDVAAGTFMVDRTTSNSEYVRIVPGPAVYFNGTNNVVYRHYATNNRFDPTQSHPLFADLLQNDNATAYRIAAHNNGNAYAGIPYGGPAFQIDSEGANSIWEDCHLEWHVWPVHARTWPDNYPDGGQTISPYPHSLAAGDMGDGHTDGWTMSGNQYFRQYWWGKVAILP